MCPTASWRSKVTCGAPSPSSWVADLVLWMPPEPLPNSEIPPARSVHRGVDRDVHVRGDDDVELADLTGDVDGAAVERLGVRELGQVEDVLADVEGVDVHDLRRRAREDLDGVAVDLLAGQAAFCREDGDDQADRDQPAGAAEERADHEHRADHGDHDGGIAKSEPGTGAPDTSTIPTTPTASAASAMVNQKSLGPRSRGLRRDRRHVPRRLRRHLGVAGVGCSYAGAGAEWLACSFAGWPAGWLSAQRCSRDHALRERRWALGGGRARRSRGSRGAGTLLVPRDEEPDDQGHQDQRAWHPEPVPLADE